MAQIGNIEPSKSMLQFIKIKLDEKAETVSVGNTLNDTIIQ